MSIRTNRLEAIQALSAGRWLARGIIPAGGLVRLVGAWGSWKTFLLMKLSVCAANGVPFFGRETEKSLVYYVSTEDEGDAHIRCMAAEMDTVGKHDNKFLQILNFAPRVDSERGFQELRARLGLQGLYNETSKIIDKYIPEDSDKAKELWALIKPSYKYYIDDDGEPPLFDFCYNDPKKTQEFLAKEPLTPLERIKIDMLHILYSDDCSGGINEEDYAREFPELFTKEAQRQCGVFDWRPPTVLIIDTYSTTADNDDKNAVAQYHRNLRRLQEEFREMGSILTVIICDHFTKSGDSYMGSLAKAGDMDAMLFLKKRNGVARLTCEKMRSSIPFAPIDITAQTFDTGLLEKNGEKITTLVLRDGSEKKNLIDTAGSEAAALILELMQESEDGIERKDLQDAFIESQLEENPDQKKDSIRRQFNRYLSKMIKSEVIEESEGLVFLIDD